VQKGDFSFTSSFSSREELFLSVFFFYLRLDSAPPHMYVDFCYKNHIHTPQRIGTEVLLSYICTP
jgi:hypothetical protein